MNLRKKLVASLVVAAMSVTAAFSAFAAAGDTKTVSFYTYDEDSEEFVASSHGSSCVSSCVEDADGNYTIEFLVDVAAMSAISLTLMEIPLNMMSCLSAQCQILLLMF